MTTSALPIACTLTPNARGDRESMIARINRRWLHRHAQQGAVLTLTYDRAAGVALDELVRLERHCCAFLTFNLRGEGNEIVLRIEAPADVEGASTLLAPFLAGADDDADVGSARLAGIAGGASATAALACGVCCVVPVAFPGIALTALGGTVAAFAHAYRWALDIALLLVIAGWLGVAVQGIRARRAPRRAPRGATVRAMLVATAVFALASSWPLLEPSVTALVRR